jgi:glycosyltransferase involved in cell wall biosynthesis
MTVITYSNESTDSKDGQLPFKLVRIRRRASKLRNYLSCFLTIMKHIREADIVYTLDWFSVGVPLMLAAFLRRKQYIVRVGGGYIWEKYLSEGKLPVTLREFYESGLHTQYRAMFFLIKKVLQRAHVVIFNSFEQRALYEKYYGISPDHTTTIFNALPEYKFEELITSYKHAHGERDKEIVFAGRFIKMKNIESLIKAFAKISDPQFRLILIGEGPLEQQLRALCMKLKIAGRVEFTGALSQRELYRRVANAYLVVIPSWTDISPHQAYECLALGIPFLITQENYLAINKFKFMKIDPRSVEDIAAKMNFLLIPEHYEDFVQSLQQIQFSYTWERVLVEHLKLFKLLQM